MDIAKAGAAGTPMPVGGTTYTLMPVRVRELAEYSAWLRAKLTNPIAAVIAACRTEDARAEDDDAARAVVGWENAREAAVRMVADDKAPPHVRLKAEQEWEKRQRAECTPVYLAYERARQWRAHRREMFLKAYADSYGPCPPIEDPLFEPIVGSLEGRCYELWLSLRKKHADEFPDHHAVEEFFRRHPDELMRFLVELAKLNDPDPEKNGHGPPNPTDGGPAPAGSA